MPKVDTRHKDYESYFKKWQKTRRFIRGEVKEFKTEYLPRLSGQSDSQYTAYLTRAQFTGYSGRALNVCNGQLFRKVPSVVGLDTIQAMIDNIDLTGKSFTDLSRELATEMISMNRIGVWLDYSEKMQQPKLTPYQAPVIINWQKRIINGQNVLSRVVLEIDVAIDGDDEFQESSEKNWVELFLDDNDLFTVQTWKKTKNSKGEEDFVVIDDSIKTPTMKGARLDFIPFYPITSDGISTELSPSPFFDFAEINHGHYINSADKENRLHMTGATTVIVKGAIKDNPKEVALGGGIQFTDPAGDAHFMEATSDAGLALEMTHKEQQMAVMMNSMLSGNGRYVASAQTADISSQGEYATLADQANALSGTMTKIMKVFAQWAGVEELDKIVIKYNTDYDTSMYNPLLISALSGLQAARAISKRVLFNNLKKAEIIPEDMTFEQLQKEIKEDEAEAQKARGGLGDPNSAGNKIVKIVPPGRTIEADASSNPVVQQEAGAVKK